MEIKKEILALKNLEIGYSGISILPPINTSLNEGDLIALVGPNGAGKSTLFKTLSAHIKPVGGLVELLGKDLFAYNPKERASILGIVLTERPEEPFLKVYDIVASGRFPYTGFFGNLNHDDETYIKESLEIVGIIKLIDRIFVSLSDGEKQKVMIAKAIAQNTKIIFMDEPTAFLDYPSKIELFALMKRLTTEQNKTILFSSHDLELLIRYTDKLWMVSPEKPLVSGQSNELLKNGIVYEYFGMRENFSL